MNPEFQYSFLNLILKHTPFVKNTISDLEHLRESGQSDSYIQSWFS